MTQWVIAMESIGLLWICCMLASSLMMDFIGHTGADAKDLRGVPCHYDITSEGLKATCSHRYLTAVPTNLTHDITVLDLTQNQLTKLDNTSFTSLPHLRYLYLQSNNMSTIESGAFQALPELCSISLTNNNFTSLPTNIFSRNQNLQIVDLSANRFVSFPGNALNSVPSLTRLSLEKNLLSSLNFTGWRSRNMTSLVLSSNNFSSLHEDDFLSLKEARIDLISFAKNNLTSLENGLFQNLDGVREMSLTDNQISKLSFHLFLGMSSLETLHMASNLISAIEPLAPLPNQTNVIPNLTYLDLQSNRIPSIPPRAFWGLGNLIQLDIHQSRIDTLQNDSFKGLESLEILDLTGNHLSYVTKDMLLFSSRLQSVVLSSNWFTELSPKQFGDIASLTSLNLARCRITDLRPQSGGWNLRNLKVLDISYNRLVRIDKNSFYGMANLTTLDISNNRLLTTIENGAFASIGRLQSLSLSHLSYLGQLHSPFTNLIELTILDMSYTSVALSYELFTGLSNLRRLSMRGSGLSASSFWDSHTEDLPVAVQSERAPEDLMYGVPKTWNHDGRARLDYEYDINLAFDDDDEQWVRGILKPGLEERLTDFDRIVCGDDDLPLGMYYIEAITEVFDQCYKSILIVSNRAVDNHSFISKLRLAVDQMNEVELEKGILIFKEDIPDGRLPYLVRLFLNRDVTIDEHTNLKTIEQHPFRPEFSVLLGHQGGRQQADIPL
eukprot:XP_011676258.1 PREDICTED: leucine-rich repeat-containing protein 15-like [Strongylocentrotus purpuratus]